MVVAEANAQSHGGDGEASDDGPLFDDDTSQPLEPFPRLTYDGEGWEMYIRSPPKKKLTSHRYHHMLFRPHINSNLFLLINKFKVIRSLIAFIDSIFQILEESLRQTCHSSRQSLHSTFRLEGCQRCISGLNKIITRAVH